jgi:hypothetical protein
MAVFRIPTHQYRSIASPVGESKLGVFFSRTAILPDDLYNWRDVNPREVKRKTRSSKHSEKILIDFTSGIEASPSLLTR